MAEQLVVVAGAAGLVGREVCARLAADGWVVVVADIEDQQTNAVASTILAAGGQAEAAYLDVTSSVSIDSLIADMRNRYGGVTAVVNSAYPRGAAYGRKLPEVSFEDFCENVSLHLGGFFLLAQRFAFDMESRGGGMIVNIASIYGIAVPQFSNYEGTSMTMPVEYAAVKSGVIQLTRYFAQYFKKAGVRFNAVAPGGVRDSQPASFVERYEDATGVIGMLSAQDVAGSVAFLLSRDARAVNGQVLVVDDGWSL